MLISPADNPSRGSKPGEDVFPDELHNYLGVIGW